MSWHHAIGLSLTLHWFYCVSLIVNLIRFVIILIKFLCMHIVTAGYWVFHVVAARTGNSTFLLCRPYSKLWEELRPLITTLLACLLIVAPYLLVISYFVRCLSSHLMMTNIDCKADMKLIQSLRNGSFGRARLRPLAIFFPVSPIHSTIPFK